MSPGAASLAPLAALLAIVVTTTKNPSLGVIAGAVLALATLARGRVDAGVGVQRVGLAVAAALGFFLGTSLAPASELVRDRLTGLWCSLALAFALPALARPLFRRPEAGARGTFALGVAAIAFAGQRRGAPLFVPLAWGFAGLCVAAMRAEDLGRPRLRALPARRWALGVAVLLSAVGAVALAARTLPPLHARAVDQVMRALRGSATTGFDEQFALGSLETMLSSDEVVARVFGPSPEMLRGIAYNRYERGRWTTRGASRLRRTATGPLRGDGDTMVETLSASAPVYFLPLELEAVATADGAARVDALGAFWRVPGDVSLRAWYRAGPRREFAPAPPSDDDLLLTPGLAARLAPLARSWTSPTAPPAARVDAIVRALRGNYRYRLAVGRTTRVDPRVDSLFLHREGHCEYFATAAALLARSVGVPARVVGGYRVGEFNALGGFHIVRERHAHAWIEIWDGSGAWVTVDPTPERAIPGNQPHNSPWLRALRDALAVWFAALRDWVAARTAAQLLGSAAALLGAWQFWRFWRARNTAREDTRTFAADERPLGCLERLDAELARRGLGRAPGETLERHAARVEAADALVPGDRAMAAEALRAYSALRYGGGDEAAVSTAMDAASARLRSPL